MKRQHIFLGLIVLFFLFTRLYKITQIPASVYWDEASIGYNAYCLGLDGKDEWGNFLPLHFRAFGEFKLPVYIYSTALSEKIFGPGIFAVRLPSVFFSTISLVLVYLIAKKLFGEKAGLFSALFFAVAPWNFIFSRTGYEVSSGLMFFLCGIYLFIVSEKKPSFFLLSVASFIASFYSYNSFRIVSPLFTAIFGIIFLLRNGENINLKTKILYLACGATVFALSLVPVYRLYKFDAGASRIYQVRAGWSTVIKNYFSHYSPDFLFLKGDANLRSNNPGFGELYVASIPFLFLGVYVIVRKKPAFWWLPLLGILVGPIPAAITKESPHALRAIAMFPFFAIVAGVGMSKFVGLFKKEKLLVVFIVVAVFLFSFESYFTDFLTKYPKNSARDWQYGYEKIFENYSASFDKYQKIIISDEYAQPYIFALFYQKINPTEFRKTATYNPVDNWGFSTIKSFDNFIFKKITAEDLQKDTLVFATNMDKIENVEPGGKILNPDGSTSFWVYSK